MQQFQKQRSKYEEIFKNFPVKNSTKTRHIVHYNNLP